MCVMVDTFMDLERQIWGGYFLVSTFLGQGQPCVFCSAARWPMCFPVSCLHPHLSVESRDYRHMAFVFSFSWAVGFDFR